MSIPSETSVFSYCSIFIIHTDSCLSRVDCAVKCSFNSIFNGKLSSVSNLTFMESLIYSPFLPPFIVSISFLIPFQSLVYFFNTSLFSSVESKTKYLNIYSHFFLQRSSTQYVHLLYQLSNTKDLPVNIFTIINFFNCNVSNILNINVFVRFFVYL